MSGGRRAEGGGRAGSTHGGSKVGRRESVSRRGVLLRGVGSGVGSGVVPGKSGTTQVVAEPTGNGGGTGAAGEMGRGGGGEEGAVGDVGGEKGGGGGCGGGYRGREERSIRARLEDLKLWTACCRAPGSLGALSKRRIN